MSQNEFYFTQKSDWRKWLAENHTQKEAVWLLLYKKDTQKPTLSYDEVVEQALCFGWIDGTVKGIDHEKYKRKLMPRTNFNNWSEKNQRRVKKLITNGEMTSIGLAKIGNYAKTGKLVWLEIKAEPILTFTEKMLELLKTDQLAFDNFSNMNSSQKKNYTRWVMSAKREETQIRRMNEAIVLLRKNTKNLLK